MAGGKDTSDLIAESLAGITGITVSNKGITTDSVISPQEMEKEGFDFTKVTDQGARHFVKVGHRLIAVKSGNELEQLKELEAMGILIPPKPPTKKTIETHPPDRLGPNFLKKRHKILQKIKARKKR